MANPPEIRDFEKSVADAVTHLADFGHGQDQIFLHRHHIINLQMSDKS